MEGFLALLGGELVEEAMETGLGRTAGPLDYDGRRAFALGSSDPRFSDSLSPFSPA